MASILGAAQTFAVLGGSTVTNTGPSAIVGDLGVSPGTAVTGFPPGVVTGGAIHSNDATAVQAQADAATAYALIAGEPVLPANILTGQDLGGQTLSPGVYFFATSAPLTGTLTLDAGGDPNARFDFRIGTTFITGTGAAVNLINGAQADNVYFQVGTSATLGTGTAFAGNILADQSISVTTGASIQGRALAINGAVTLDTNSVTAVQADLAVAKTLVPGPVVAGSTISYTVTVSNIGPGNAADVVLTDQVPLGTTFVSAVQTSGAAFALTTPAVGGTGLISGSLDLLPSENSAVFTVTVLIAPSLADGALVVNTASGSTTTTDPNPENDSQTVIVAVSAVADLAVTKTVSSSPVVAGSAIAYTITVANVGPSDAQGISLADLVPAGTTFLSAVQTAGPTFALTTPAVGGTGAISGTLASFASGASAVFTVTVLASPSLADGALVTNTATGTTTTTDPNPENDSQTVIVAVSAVADLAVTKTVSSSPVVAGSAIAYTITVANVGPSDAQGISLADLVPAGTTFLSAVQTAGPTFALTTPAVGGTGAIGGTLATLAAGASASFTVSLLILPSTGNGTFVVNTASASTTTTDPVPANNSQTVNALVAAVADLAVTKTVSSSPVVAGRAIAYTVTVSNVGPSDSVGVALADLVPAGTSFLAVVQTAGPTFTFSTPAVGGTGSISGTLASLAAGASASFTVTLLILPSTGNGALVTNTASVTAATTDSVPANNSQSASAAVAAQADVAVTKTVSSSTVVAGRAISYTVTVSNVGPSDAQGVTLADLVPAGTTFLSAVQTAGPTFALTTPAVGGTGSIGGTLASLASGASAVFTVTVMIAPSFPGGTQVVNTASASTITTDLNPANDSQTAAAIVAALPITPVSPVVVALQRFGIHAQATTLVIGFSTPLDPVGAQDPANYRISLLGGPGQAGHRGMVINVTQVDYDPIAQTVTLHLAQRLNIHYLYQLTILGAAPDGVAGLDGGPLAGAGSPGTDYVAVISMKTLAGRAPATARVTSTPTARLPRVASVLSTRSIVPSTVAARQTATQPRAGLSLRAGLSARFPSYMAGTMTSAN
ncbi:ice-binding family protein [Paludisphaera mucosa]|uniref:Ice-binding family protein n=1 Tax=Paludisphaera mucosa TaxID=3030827 RepID=A0ABT6F984_9BACT|nr:ice-binding family protein [Paludisphaera mucosa]MDG3004143.1 ice-binding family protein [Paludisphaera mucosa]